MECLCSDCQVDTLKNEFYMVQDELWELVCGPEFLCIACLEARLGRQLVSTDFPDDILLNAMAQDKENSSERLKDRLKNWSYNYEALRKKWKI